ncbi:YqaJ viral recombinase family protein [Dubosiella newyorkensis]|uniref:YqaJ viral recombinase family nuclease n=1 Tax=Dubosiella newyorkensis TaxID=1862672 RepID=UPI002572F573|nr:YqaJ viral recombinase family protein [Dubosiella newyorkensis]
MIKHKIPSTHEEWLADRRVGIGGSDAGVILGYSPYKSPYTLWAEKCGLIDDEVPDNYYMRDGRDIEEIVAKRFAEEEDVKVSKSTYSYQSEEHPFMLGNIDRWIKRGKIGLEIKTMDVRKRINLDGGDIPPQYYAQCVHYMAVTGAEEWWIAIWQYGQPLRKYCIKRDEEEIQALIEAEEAFWKCVETGTPPEIDGSESTSETLKQLHPTAEDQELTLIRSEEAEQWKSFDQHIKDVKEKLKLLENEKKAIENTFKADMEDAKFAVCDDLKITWTRFDSNRFDITEFKKSEPELYEQLFEKYHKTTKSDRLTIKKIEM